MKYVLNIISMRNKVLEMFREFQFCPGGKKILKDDVLFVVVFFFILKVWIQKHKY